MRKPKLYLAGPIADCTDEECTIWRKLVTEELSNLYDISDPFLRGDYRDNIDNRHDAEIVEGDKKEIEDSDVILVNWWKISIGTSMEVLYAWELGKVIVTVTTSKHPWLCYHSHLLFDNMNLAIETIKEMQPEILREKGEN